MFLLITRPPQSFPTRFFDILGSLKAVQISCYCTCGPETLISAPLQGNNMAAHFEDCLFSCLASSSPADGISILQTTEYPRTHLTRARDRWNSKEVENHPTGWTSGVINSSFIPSFTIKLGRNPSSIFSPGVLQAVA